jgi:hypothetical protein
LQRLWCICARWAAAAAATTEERQLAATSRCAAAATAAAAPARGAPRTSIQQPSDAAWQQQLLLLLHRATSLLLVIGRSLTHQVQQLAKAMLLAGSILLLAAAAAAARCRCRLEQSRALRANCAHATQQLLQWHSLSCHCIFIFVVICSVVVCSSSINVHGIHASNCRAIQRRWPALWRTERRSSLQHTSSAHVPRLTARTAAVRPGRSSSITAANSAPLESCGPRQPSSSSARSRRWTNVAG